METTVHMDKLLVEIEELTESIDGYRAVAMSIKTWNEMSELGDLINQSRKKRYALLREFEQCVRALRNERARK